VISNRDLDNALCDFDSEDRAVATQYVEFLIQNDLGFFCSSVEEVQAFAPMQLSWEYPSKITNAVIELSNDAHIPAVIKCIGGNYVPTLQLILHIADMSINQLNSLIEAFYKLPNKSIQIVFENNQCIEVHDLKNFCTRYPKIELIIAFNSQIETTVKINDCSIILTKQKDFSKSTCGTIHQEYFNTGLKHFTESLRHNSCLNGKVSIDCSGNIKNCPSMENSFCNIWNTNLLEAVESEGFKKYWNISKDTISVCKDCEFRHVCTDCRAYLEDPEDNFSKPLKCGYNPYTNVWEDWSSNPLKKQAKTHYHLNNM
jgi:SPASM domain peptide maturase of grasp-with-spasm system